MSDNGNSCPTKGLRILQKVDWVCQQKKIDKREKTRGQQPETRSVLVLLTHTAVWACILIGLFRFRRIVVNRATIIMYSSNVLNTGSEIPSTKVLSPFTFEINRKKGSEFCNITRYFSQYSKKSHKLKNSCNFSIKFSSHKHTHTHIVNTLEMLPKILPKSSCFRFFNL